MRFFSCKTALGFFLIAALLVVTRDHGTAQDANTKQPEPAPTATAPEAEATYSETDLDKLDTAIRESGGKDTEAYMERALLNDTLKYRYRVIDDLENFERLGGKDVELHALRAQAKMQTGDFAGALEDFQAGLKLGNKLDFRHSVYVLALHFNGNSKMAMTELDQAIKAEPDNTGNFDLRGIINRSQGNRAAALKDHDQSLKITPDNAYALVERACTNFAFGDYATAKKDFEKALQLGSADSYIYRYYAYFLATCEDEKFRDAQRALQLAGVALDLDPEDGFALNAKACALALLGEYDVAVGAGLRARENREFANDPEIGGGVEAKAYLAAWKQGKPLFRTPDKEK